MQLDGFGADGLNLIVNFWIADPENGQGNVRSAVNLRVMQALAEAGVSIPFPQRELRRVNLSDAPGAAIGAAAAS